MKIPKIGCKKLSFILNIMLVLLLIAGFMWHKYIISYQMRDSILMRCMIRANILGVLDSSKKQENKIVFLKENIANSLDFDSKLLDCNFFEIEHIFQPVTFISDKEFKDTEKHILQILKTYHSGTRVE